MAKHVADALSTVADEIIISVAKGKSGAYAEMIDADLRLVEDKSAELGPLEGLVRGFEAARGKYVLVSPCDTPFLKKAVCEAVVAAAEGKDGAVPMTGSSYLEPLHGAYSRTTCLDAFRKVLSMGGRAPTEAYKGLEIVFLDERTLRTIDPELQSFWNINDKDDLRKAEAQLARLR